MCVVGTLFHFFVPRFGGNCLTNEANPFSAHGELPEKSRRAQYFHVLICPPRVWRYKSLFSSSAQGRAMEAVRK